MNLTFFRKLLPGTLPLAHLTGLDSWPAVAILITYVACDRIDWWNTRPLRQPQKKKRRKR